MIVHLLTVKNVMRIRVAEVAPDGSLITVAGPNGAGKSSFVGSLPFLLGGKALCPEVPIRRGETSAEASVILGEPDDEDGNKGAPLLKVTRSWKLNEAPKLTVREHGARTPLKKPQQILDALRGHVAFDPEAYTRMPKAELLEVVRRLAGLDLSELDEARDQAFAARTNVNRDLHRERAVLDSLARHPGVPEEEVSMRALVVELEKRKSHNADNAVLVRSLDDARRTEATCVNEVQRRRNVVFDLETQIEEARESLVDAEGTLYVQRRAVLDGADGVSVLHEADEAEVHAQIAGAEDVNRRVRENLLHAAALAKVDALEAKADALTRTIDTTKEERAVAIANAEYPIEGLGVTDDGVTFDGLPVGQTSTGQKLVIGCAIGFALNPAIKVLWIENGAALDRKNRALVGTIAKEHKGQCFVEVIDPEGAAVVIEDGEVVDPPTEDGGAA